MAPCGMRVLVYNMGVRLNRLILSNIRNLGALDLNFGPQFNVFVGPNGSGKTSLLEAIHLLGIGRSFRSRSIRQIISFGAEQCVIRAQVGAVAATAEDSNLWLAVERKLGGDAHYKIGGQTEASAIELTKMLPVQLIDVNSHLLLEGGPNFRRQFIDWGVFHVEHSFLHNWRAMRRALEQRNEALKQRQEPASRWTETFTQYAMAVDAARSKYVHEFSAAFLPMLHAMLGITALEVCYHSGWPEGRDLATAMATTMRLDLAYGYTHCGPQRADLTFTLNGRPIKDVLSRGQLKILVCIMLLARAHMLRDLHAGLFLIDDLHAELDKSNCSLLINAIRDMGCQVFITGIEADLLRDRLQGCITQTFHVEQGLIKEQAI